MANIRVDLNGMLADGQEVTFKAPCDCTEIEGIKVYYPKNGEIKNKLFTMKDSHGFDLAGVGNLFMAGSYVHVILDTNNGFAYLQNADTNKYLEDRFNNLKPEVVDNLTSTSTDLPLSANQGRELNNKLASFEATKSDIVGSPLGKALGMSTSDKWADVVSDIKGVANNGSVNKTITPSSTEQSYTIPKGYHSGSGKVICGKADASTIPSKTGTFNDWNAVTINCGFKPKIVIVTNFQGCATYDQKSGKNVAVVKGNIVNSNPFTISDTGFTFAAVTNMNATDCSYIAYG